LRGKNSPLKKSSNSKTHLVFLDKVGRTDYKDTMEVDADLHFNLLVSTISQRADFTDLKRSNVRIHHGDISIVLGIHRKVVPSVKGEDLGEWHLVELREDHHVTSVRLGLPVQFDGKRLQIKNDEVILQIYDSSENFQKIVPGYL
jgi:hypothetical protein